eukprot:m.58012 g.58012  ORF g.58012 m.58012 type:complete len:271 (-) comp22485_c1_seq1:657-1469(-)
MYCPLRDFLLCCRYRYDNVFKGFNTSSITDFVLVKFVLTVTFGSCFLDLISFVVLRCWLEWRSNRSDRSSASACCRLSTPTYIPPPPPPLPPIPTPPPPIANSDDIALIHPCPICFSNEDDSGDCGQCFKCGQIFCGECRVEIRKSQTACPTCRASQVSTIEEDCVRLFSLVHERAIGRHTSFAQCNLGIIYLYTHRFDHAFKYFKLAADQGHPAAMFNLAAMFENGHGVQKNRVLAFTLCKMAADQGLAIAQQYVANMIHQHGTVKQRL